MIPYYHEHAEEYAKKTGAWDLSSAHEMLEKYLPKGSSILDVGFGSARDMLYFASQGYEVFGIDQEEKFVEEAKEKGLNVQQADLLSYEPKKKADAIWCCACLVHLPQDKIDAALAKMKSWLKEDGILFLSMKTRDAHEEEVDELGRYMTYWDQQDIDRLPYRVLESELRKDATREGFLWWDGVMKP